MAARTGAAVLCMVLLVCAGLLATPTEAHVYAAVNTNVAGGAATATASGGGIRPGRWNKARRLQAGGDAAHKREVPDGPDPQHHH